jgi:hypothetical protein
MILPRNISKGSQLFKPEQIVWSLPPSTTKLDTLANSVTSPKAAAARKQVVAVPDTTPDEDRDEQDNELAIIDLEQAHEHEIDATSKDALTLPPGLNQPAGQNSSIIMRISSNQHINFSTQPFLTEDLALATHASDLEYHPRPFTSLNIDPCLMGIGGDDSWSACVHEDHLLLPDIYSFDLSFSFHCQ